MTIAAAGVPPFVTAASHEEAVATLIRTLERRDTVSDEEKAALAGIVAETRVHPDGDILLRAGRPTEFSTLLVEGMLGRAFNMVDGKRQIVAVHVAGDFVDLHSFLLKKLDHDVIALTNTKVVLMAHDSIRAIGERHPHLMRMLWLLTMIDAAIHRDWTARLGHSAAVRVALLLCELQARLEVVGRATKLGFALPLTQVALSEMVGLTPVHLNRTLRKLRESGLATVRDGFASVPDLAKLRRFAAFDPSYLYLERLAR
jgi:CRP-like cAMP-binding protein